MVKWRGHWDTSIHAMAVADMEWRKGTERMQLWGPVLVSKLHEYSKPFPQNCLILLFADVGAPSSNTQVVLKIQEAKDANKKIAQHLALPFQQTLQQTIFDQ